VTQVRQSPQTVQNVVTYDAVVGVANPDLALKPGLTASTRIVVAEKSDVLRVPNQALRYVPGGVAGAGSAGAVAPAVASSDAVAAAGAGKAGRLWVLRDGKPVAVAVVVGLDDENFAEIVKGDLKAGDPVIVSAASASAGGLAAVPQPRL
jgi:HlyD family secretion protein